MLQTSNGSKSEIPAEYSHGVSSPELTVLARQLLLGRDNILLFSHVSAMMVRIFVLTPRSTGNTPLAASQCNG